MSEFGQLRELTRARVLLFLREPEALFWVFVFPIVLAAVLGFAFRTAEIEPNPVGVLEGPAADELVARLEPDELLAVERFEDADVARKQLFGGAIDVLVDPGDGSGPPVLTFDPQRSEGDTARLRVLRALDLARSGGAGAEVTLEPVTETGSRYVDFLFPGLLGMNLMGTGMWGIGFAIADMRRKRLLKRLMVTPMRRSSFFLSFILSRLVFLALEVLVLLLVGHYLLGVPFRTGALGFAVLTLVGAFPFAGLGVLVAARVRTIEGVSGLMNLVMMPMWLASGVFFSYERFPDAIHPVLRLLPLTALNDAMRSMMLDGEGLIGQWPEVIVLSIWSVVTVALALRIFRWE